jgi:hypothetical protein
MQVDWVRTPYQTKGTYTSAVFDAGGAVDWTTAMLTANIPAGTSVLIETSTGNTATPDSTWSAWSAVDSAGNITSPNGQYLRYRLTLTSNNGSATPIVSDVTFKYA